MKKETGARPTFEQSMEQLQEKVRALESGSLSLDDALHTYEEAVALIRVCNRTLETAKQKVSRLTEDENGAVHEVAFGNDET